MKREQHTTELCRIAKVYMKQHAQLFKCSHPCGIDIIPHEDIKKAIPEAFHKHFYECSRGSTCVKQGMYVHDVMKFIDLL